MSVLVDTSVWIEHFRRPDVRLAQLLAADLVLTHSMVRAEIACGTPPQRARTLSDLSLLLPCREATLDETIEFVEREAIYGLGCGLIDLSLLASTLITPGATLWTRDRRLAGLAHRFDVAA